ncbi:hypothetical protein E2C01_037855 [Portunus trituberculatus]|uniref:Uncharacterized protein n=1 Tax=Portunus trituberculatus TaxID=210409 RepID=A0A5B7F989_PORTR|nr:hypothetical protein [Portunus trituberculatus]
MKPEVTVRLTEIRSDVSHDRFDPRLKGSNMRIVVVFMRWPSQAVMVLTFWISTATVPVLEIDGLEGGVTDGWLELQLDLSHLNIMYVGAAQQDASVEAGGGDEILTAVVPVPPSSFY